MTAARFCVALLSTAMPLTQGTIEYRRIASEVQCALNFYIGLHFVNVGAYYLPAES